MSFLKNLSRSGKLALIIGWAVASMALLTLLSLYPRWQQLLEEPRTLALSLVEIANGVVERYQKQEQTGSLTREKDQKLAIETLRNMRYQDPVSYTHLDVYKRQQPGNRNRPAGDA